LRVVTAVLGVPGTVCTLDVGTIAMFKIAPYTLFYYKLGVN